MRRFTLIATAFIAGTTFFASAQDNWYIRGPFNDYNPDGKEVWALTPGEEKGVFTGTFEIPEGEFEINFQNPDENVFVPYNSSYFESVNQTVEFTDNVFTGQSTLAWDDYEEAYMWKMPDWDGGKITVNIYATSNNPKVEFIYLPEDDSTGIKGVELQPGAMKVYNLNGVKVMEGNNFNQLTPGIYIVNGKKVVVR